MGQRVNEILLTPNQIKAWKSYYENSRMHKDKWWYKTGTIQGRKQGITGKQIKIWNAKKKLISDHCNLKDTDASRSQRLSFTFNHDIRQIFIERLRTEAEFRNTSSKTGSGVITRSNLEDLYEEHLARENNNPLASDTTHMTEYGEA